MVSLTVLYICLCERSEAISQLNKSATPDTAGLAMTSYLCDTTLVDDNRLRRTVTAFLSEESGFVISQANTGEQAHSMIDEGRYEYDLVIVELAMPEISGPALADVLIKSHPDIPVFVVKGFHDKMWFMELLNGDDKSVHKFARKRTVIK